MKFIIGNESTEEISSMHGTLEEARDAYLGYYQKCCDQREMPKDWIYKQKIDGDFQELPKKQQIELRRFFIENR